MKRIINVVAVLLLLQAGCASQIHTETRPVSGPGIVAGSQTYHWVESDLSLTAPTEVPSSTFTQAIREEVDNSLANRGYKRVTTADADFAIDAVLTLSREESEHIETNMVFDQEDYLKYGLRWRFVPNRSIVKPDPAYPNIELSVYERGTLHVGAFDREGKLVWHGEAHKVIEIQHTPAEHEQVLREATRKILLNFPRVRE